MQFHNPGQKTRIPGVKEGEKAEFILWRHWIIPVMAAVLLILLLILPFLIWFVVPAELMDRISGTAWEGVAMIAFIMYVFLIWMVFTTFFVDYYLDTWIVTNQRIVDIEQKGLFRRVISQHHLIRVQDVTSDIAGIVHTLLDFGDVHVQTAGTRGRFQFTQIPHPNEVKQRIIQLQKGAVSRLSPNQYDRLIKSGTPYATNENES